MIALGVIAAVWLAGRRLEQKGIGTRDDDGGDRAVGRARRHHRRPALPRHHRLELFRDDPVRMLYDLGGRPRHLGRHRRRRRRRASWRAKRRGLPLPPVLDAAAPALPLAQAIGRLGQLVEPGAVRPADHAAVGPGDRRRAPPGGLRASTPRSTPRSCTSRCGTWRCAACCSGSTSKAGCGPGRLIVVYVAGYTFARFFIEGLRIDTANKIGGLRRERVGVGDHLPGRGAVAGDRHLGAPRRCPWRRRRPRSRRGRTARRVDGTSVST